jgi:hypothetical protein
MRTPKRNQKREADDPSDIDLAKEQAWIDEQRKRLDEQRLALELSPRRNEKSDEERAREYLTGKIDRQGCVTYLEPGSQDEKEGLEALLRLLRSDKDLMNVRWRLAALLDRDHPDPRILKFHSRRRGVLPEYVRDVEIAHGIAVDVLNGVQIEAAVQSAVERHGVARATAYRAWVKHRKAWLRRPPASPLN